MPAIIGQPQNQNVTIGSNATFTVSATGGNLGYQWRFNTGAIGGATAASYTVVNAQTNNAGQYSVLVTNSLGSTSQLDAMLMIPGLLVPKCDRAAQRHGANGVERPDGRQLRD